MCSLSPYFFCVTLPLGLIDKLWESANSATDAEETWSRKKRSLLDIEALASKAKDLVVHKMGKFNKLLQKVVCYELRHCADLPVEKCRDVQHCQHKLTNTCEKVPHSSCRGKCRAGPREKCHKVG